MCGGDKDRTARVPSLTNEEPLVVVKAGIDIVGEVIGEDGGDSRDGMIRDRETALRVSGRGGVRQRSPSTEDGYIGRGRGIHGHRGSKVFAAWGGDEDVVGIDGNIFVEWSEEESVEDFLGYAGRCGRHGRRG